MRARAGLSRVLVAVPISTASVRERPFPDPRPLSDTRGGRSLTVAVLTIRVPAPRESPRLALHPLERVYPPPRIGLLIMLS